MSEFFILTNSNIITYKNKCQSQDYLPEPSRTTVRQLLRHYVDLRLSAQDWRQLEGAISQSETVQDAIWNEVVKVVEKNQSPTTALFIQSINQILDLHEERLLALVWTRIPDLLWTILYLLTALGIGALGYQYGLSKTRHMPIYPALILGFAVIFYLIADLDRPFEGIVKVGQNPMIKLQEKLKGS